MKYPLALVALILAGCMGNGSQGSGSPQASSTDRSFTTSRFAGSDNCAPCHNGLYAPDGSDLSIVNDTRASAMGMSAIDPIWRAKAATELIRAPHLADEIADTCTRCHAPMANVEAKGAGAHLTLFDAGGLLDPASAWYPMAVDGVGCTLCHTIADDPTLGTVAGFSGGYVIDESRRIFGQYDDPVTFMMQRWVDYTPTGSAHISSSKLCATCHELRTPFVDAAGNLVPQTEADYFPEQSPYSEWEQSAYRDGGAKAQTCVDCHLANIDGVVIANRPMSLAPRNGFARHLIVGSNTFLQGMVRDNQSAFGAPSASYDAAITATRSLLQGGATVSVERATLSGDTLSFDVVATNKGGHKLPTSYPSRRAFLTVTVTDAAGAEVFSSGAVADDGSVAGDDGAIDPFGYEPHHDLITDAGEVQIYEPVMGNSDGEVTHTLLRAARYLKDNRLLPEGFDKTAAPSSVSVVGGALTDDDFVGGSDRVGYRVAVGSAAPFAAAPFTVTVAFNYQTISQPFARDLAVDSADATVAAGVGYIAGGANRTETMATTSVTVDR